MIKFVSLINLSGTRVDRDSDVIKGVSLISLGEARGHGKRVDQKTLESVLACAKTYKDGLRVKFNPETFAHGDGSLAGRVPVSTLRIEDNKVVGDLHVYKALNPSTKEYLYEIAETTPGNIGFSIEFTGDDEEVEGQKFARCSEIYAATVVDIPAANPTGLFSVPEFQNLTTLQDKRNPSTTDNNELTNMDKETITALSTGIAEALKPILKQTFAEAFPPAEKSKEDKEKEEAMAAGVTDDDDEKAKKDKVAAFRVGNKKVSEMTASELSASIVKGNMQFFRQAGGKPAKASEGDGTVSETPVQKFKARITKHIDAGCKSRGAAIQRARADAPDEYNEFMAAQHPKVQTMDRK